MGHRVYTDWKSGNIECAVEVRTRCLFYHVVTMFVNELLIRSLAFNIIT